ncbi:MAG: ParB/RepB/Spo0J family partition protein [Massilioclostridium sp.]|nr:ParB/RepB/Spo0J family partition protein [Massilioclostridium sp.]
MKLTDIEPNKNQPRKTFDEAALTTLADSIRQHGVIQPLVVRPLSTGGYQIIAGERRWRACRMLGLAEVPVLIKEMDDKQVMEVALIENLQREDLNPIEEALGYKQLMDEYDLTQDQVATRVGKSRPAVANALRLLNLPKQVIGLVENGNLSFGQAKAILSFEDETDMITMANLAVRKGMTVRELEKLSKKSAKAERTVPLKSKRDHYYDELEIAMRDELHRKIKIDLAKEEQGTLHIDFYSKEELADLARRLTNMNEER